jgi:hypothetical protein
MKKRIIIALIILVMAATVGLCLYFFVFKDKNMSRENAANLVNRIAIDIGAIEEYEGSPKFEQLHVGSGKDTIIRTNQLPSIQDITLTTSSLNSSKITENENALKDLILEVNALLKIEKTEMNKVYTKAITGGTIKYLYKTVKNEILLTKKITEGENTIIAYVSISYDSKDNEYEVVQTLKFNNSAYAFTRYKFNSNEILSVENYSLSNLTSEKIETALENKEGNSIINISDFKNRVYKSTQLEKTSPKNHSALSNYIYQVYSNFNEKLGENIEIIDKETKPVVIDLLP